MFSNSKLAILMAVISELVMAGGGSNPNSPKAMSTIRREKSLEEAFGKSSLSAMDEIKKAMAEMLEDIRKLKTANEEGKDELNGMKEEIRKLKLEINAIKEKKAEKTALDNFVSRINGLEERFKFDLIGMKENKWNPTEAISEEGRVIIKYSDGPVEWNSIRAKMPIKFNLNAKKPLIAYFEIEILEKNPEWGCIHIGFCTRQFPLKENTLGGRQNSIGFWHKGGITIDRLETKFGNAGGYFQVGEVIGIGILHFPAIFSIKCFATLNGNLLGWVELPQKFAHLQLYPAMSVFYAEDLTRANFGEVPFLYNPLKILQNL